MDPTEPRYYVTLNRFQIQHKLVTQWAKELPGGERLTDAQIQRAISNSTLFGLYITPMGEQVGFARVVSDNAAFSAITECYVREDHRGKGAGTLLMQTVVAHAVVKGTLCVLQTRVPGFFARFGFQATDGSFMVRNP